MLAPRKNGLIFSLYSRYFNYRLKKDFSSFTSDIEVNESQAILLLANHMSWWDGIILFHLNQKLFKKQFHVLVTANDYIEVGYLKYFGAFASEKKGKDVLETLAYAGSLLDDPNNLLLIFPQGEIKSTHLKSIAFEKGIMQVVNASKKKFQTVFAVTLFDYFNERKPKVKTYLTSWLAAEYISLQLLKSEYNKHYDAAILNQSQKAS
jgi:1-acyl-sn-glycerol-3-phosphate acyltransferase